MIKSIKFTGEFGYISKKIDEPNQPRLLQGFGDKKSEEYKSAKKQYNKELRHYNKHKDDFANPKLADNLLNRTFEFEADKINVIFGPNASGKTTIIKALAGEAMCEDGWTQLGTASDICPFSWKHNEEYSDQNVINYINTLKKNSCEIEWDGVPVYFQNFENRKSISFGDLVGSVIESEQEELLYLMNSNKYSRGQNTIFILNKVLQFAMNPVKYDTILDSYKKCCCNDIWRQAYDLQIKHFLSYENANSGLPNTILFDEMDKSMDIINVIKLYTEALPELIKRYHNQIILVSHSPIILSNTVYNSELYNIISIDEEYTKECRERMKTIF